jgi:IS605 OrfB family transposase
MHIESVGSPLEGPSISLSLQSTKGSLITKTIMKNMCFAACRSMYPLMSGVRSIRVARLQAKVADARRDFHHKLSTKLIRENQAVTVEDLAVKGLARTRLAKSVHDVGWSTFTSMLEYKARLHGRDFYRVGRFEPTSQICSSCGVKDGPKPLHIRVWKCAACGTIHDRDVNAARNIAALGRREALNACEGNVRPGPALAVPTKREAAEVPYESCTD